MILTKEQLHDALVERHGADIQAKLDKACVGIAGLGGLGSNLAIFLARLGVGHLILVDFDVVDITNLNRQHYTMKDLGIPKTLALVEQLEAINPYLTYETYTERVVPSNVERLFSGCDVVVEAFDKPDQKAMLLENLLTRLPEKPVVSGSGETRPTRMPAAVQAASPLARAQTTGRPPSQCCRCNPAKGPIRRRAGAGAPAGRAASAPALA